MCNILIDGPLEFDIQGDRVVIRGCSDGEPLTFTLILQDALISRHRFNTAYDRFMDQREAAGPNVLEFAQRRAHADTA